MAGRRGLIAALSFVVAACGGVRDGDVPEVEVNVPTPGPSQGPISTLEPVPTPTPTPTPTPRFIQPPRGLQLKAEAGVQYGAVSDYCWTTAGRSACNDSPPPSQPSPLSVKQGEQTLLVLDADVVPDSVTVRAFQGGTREGYPTSNLPPAIEILLTIDLAPGTWGVDVCAVWNSNGQPCWYFEIRVGG